MSIVLPTNINEWYAKGTFIDITNNEIYVEIPGIFVGNVLDEAATNDKIDTYIENHNTNIARRVPPNNAS